MKQQIAIFPGSFDPFTNGHHDIVIRASKLFDRVIIALGVNSNKKRVFPTEVILEKISSLYSNSPSIEVMKYEGLTADFADQQNATVIIRGLRNNVDLDYEKPIAEVNKTLNPALETIFLVTKPEYSSISSTIIRELFKYNKSIENLVPYSL